MEKMKDGTYYVFGDDAPAELWGRYFTAEELQRFLKNPTAGVKNFKWLAFNYETQLSKIVINDGEEVGFETLYDPYDCF